MIGTISKRGGRRYDGLGSASGWLRGVGTLVAVVIVPVIPIWWKFPGESTGHQLTVPGAWFQSTRSTGSGAIATWFSRARSTASSTLATWWNSH